MKNRFALPAFLLAVACALLGALLDFVFNGVFKIVWIVIYGPAYVVAAKGLATQLSQHSKTRFKPLTRVAVGGFLGGAIVLHLASTGHRRQAVYPMLLATADPITLRSEQWPQKLFVSSDKLSKTLAGPNAQQQIPVATERVTDYGCTRTFEVVSVAGVDVRSDPDARWTWKTDPRAAARATPAGPGYEDQGLPWCRIKFYRGVH